MRGDSREEGQSTARNLLGSLAGGLPNITCPNCGHAHAGQPSADEIMNRARAQRNSTPSGIRGTSPVEAAVPAHLRPATRKMPDRY